MFTSARWAVGAVLFLAVLALVGTLVLKLPVVLQMEVTRRLAPDCEPPSESDLPANVGRRVLLDVRQNGSGTTLISSALSAWAPAAMTRIALPPDRMRDLVVYAHGFNTNVTEASCVADVLRADLAQLPQYRHQNGPDVVVFSWPGEFGIFGFSKAQGSATRAARYLASLLREVSGRRIYLVGHSLGSKVVMETVSALGGSEDPHPVDGILLVEGAIPATSIRTWKSTFTASFPGAFGLDAAKPIVEEGAGTGEYVAAAALAKHVVITTARWDTVLGQAYSLDELFAPDSKNRPKVPMSVGNAPRTLPQTRAIGSPFPRNPVYVRHEHKRNSPNRYVPSGNYPSSQQSWPPYRPTADPLDTYQISEWEFDFSVPHPSFHEFQLDKWWWGPFRYRHAPLNEPLIRRDVLTRAWAIYVPLGQR